LDFTAAFDAPNLAAAFDAPDFTTTLDAAADAPVSQRPRAGSLDKVHHVVFGLL
jgi:hypothetical protein